MVSVATLTDLGTEPLDPPARAAVDALVAAATTADGAAPLSEQFLLDLRPGSGAHHLLAYAAVPGSAAPGTALVGYAQVSDGATELVVDPAHRRAGVGSLLLGAVPPDVRVWAHGDVPAAQGFAEARGLAVVRELFVLHRPLGSGRPDDELGPVALPDGLVARPFAPGRDEDEWVRVNAAAFAHHPEQGRMTRADLEERMAEAWFDPAGLLLVVPETDADTVVAFHWTKVHPAGEKGPEAVGEVYVVGVDPAYQGRGLGRPVTLLGLHHLEDAGLATVILYVDGDNPAALRVYRSLGFSTLGTDRMYARTGGPGGATMTS